MCLDYLSFLLVILKSFGCKPMCMTRCFSEAIEVSKIKRKHSRNVNYYVPLLSETRKEVILITHISTISSNWMTDFSLLKKLFLYKCLVII